MLSDLSRKLGMVGSRFGPARFLQSMPSASLHSHAVRRSQPSVWPVILLGGPPFVDENVDRIRYLGVWNAARLLSLCRKEKQVAPRMVVRTVGTISGVGFQPAIAVNASWMLMPHLRPSDIVPTAVSIYFIFTSVIL